MRNLKYEFNKDILIREMGDTTLAFNPETSDMYELNDVGRDILVKLQREVSIPILLQELCEEYSITENEIYEDVEAMIERMTELGIIKVV